ncbi:MAG: DUF1295 domain-containing protein [Flavobacteriia bacterium]|nr:DUF1295 domain-containing protein [Flavobacteriia bacterium]
MGNKFRGLLVVSFWYILAPLSFYWLVTWTNSTDLKLYNQFVRTFDLVSLDPSDLRLPLLYATIWMTLVVFLGSLLARNASVYDAYWSVAPIYFTLALPWFVAETLDARSILFMMMVFAWGVRLTANWVYTWSGLNHQDWRYTELREKTGKWYPLVNLFGIHLFPTIMVYVAFLPSLYVFTGPSSFSFVDILAFIIGAGAILLQGTADFQMHQFRKHRKKGINQKGLWKYSRHPNYLGEVLFWTAVFLFGLSSGMDFWPGVLCPLAMLLMFIFISIPMMEKRQSKKPGWSEYVRKTGMLLPKRISK